MVTLKGRCVAIIIEVGGCEARKEGEKVRRRKGSTEEGREKTVVVA